MASYFSSSHLICTEVNIATRIVLCSRHHCSDTGVDIIPGVVRIARIRVTAPGGSDAGDAGFDSDSAAFALLIPRTYTGTIIGAGSDNGAAADENIAASAMIPGCTNSGGIVTSGYSRDVATADGNVTAFIIISGTDACAIIVISTAIGKNDSSFNGYIATVNGITSTNSGSIISIGVERARTIDGERRSSWSGLYAGVISSTTPHRVYRSASQGYGSVFQAGDA